MEETAYVLDLHWVNQWSNLILEKLQQNPQSKSWTTQSNNPDLYLLNNSRNWLTKPRISWSSWRTIIFLVCMNHSAILFCLQIQYVTTSTHWYAEQAIYCFLISSTLYFLCPFPRLLEAMQKHLQQDSRKID